MKKGIIFTILLMFLAPIMVLAESNITTEITGVTNAVPGDTVAYDIKINVSEDMKASVYTATLDYNKDVLELKAVTAKDWVGSSISGNLNYTFNEGTTGSSIIATVTFKVKDNVPKQTVTISLKDVKITALDEEGSQSIIAIDEDTPQLKANLSIKSTDNTLKDLQMDGVTITGFKRDTFKYEISVSSSMAEFELKGITNNANAKFVEGFGNRKVSLNYGENEVLVKVQSESGAVETYTLIITREDDRDTNNYLKEVIINSGKIKLNLTKTRIDYTVKTYKLKNLEIDAIADHPKAKVEVQLPKEIIIGDNVAVIKVTSEAGEERVYTITFENTDEPLDTKIKTLYISGVKLDFDKNTMVYKVPFNKRLANGLNIRIVTVLNDDLVKYEIYYNKQLLTDDVKVDLKVGDKYEIRVFPLGLEEGDESETTTYTIEIVKDNRISFYLILESLILAVLLILIIIQVVIRKKRNAKDDLDTKKAKKRNGEEPEEKQDHEEVISSKKIREEITKTKVMDEEELLKIKEEEQK